MKYVNFNEIRLFANGNKINLIMGQNYKMNLHCSKCSMFTKNIY